MGDMYERAKWSSGNEDCTRSCMVNLFPCGPRQFLMVEDGPTGRILGVDSSARYGNVQGTIDLCPEREEKVIVAHG